jgi:hypothetical protein
MKKSMRYLLGVFALVLIANFASAQYVDNSSTSLGDGDNPYVGTEYTYAVSSDGGTMEWLVYDDSSMTTASASSAYSLTNGTTASATITWNTAGTYYLTYKETSADGCSTYRGVVVVVTENSFQLDLAADSDACNSEEGNVLDWTTYETKSDVTTPLTFTVNMTKDDSFSIDSWQFEGTFSLPTGISTSTITASEGAIVVSGDTFTLTGLTSESVTITYTASGLVTAGGDITLTASNGAAISGTVTTDDNGTGDLAQIITLNPLPGATNISF